jgi:ABC-type uncharacterized transport system YnjBCD permease subunit
LTLLYESDQELRPMIEKTMLESQDERVMRFVGLMQRRRAPEREGSVPMAVGELVLASFLTILGLAAFVPIVTGVTTPQQWLDYFSNAIAPSFSSGPLYQGAPLLDFVFAALLLLGAFYSLRRASNNLKRAGLSLESSGN